MPPWCQIVPLVPNQPRRTYSKRLSRQLRSKMTEPEVLLWSYLKNHQMGVKFRRQLPIGPFIVDFACFECRLVIEVDGNHHQLAADVRRDEWIASRGWRIERFWADDVYRDLDMVLDVIRHLVANTPRP